jgi:LAS superfamily LD-carboxypeptidase LdcB
VNAEELTGQTRSHISEVDQPRCALHRQVVTPFLNLRRAAALDGIDLVPASSFRDFARQLSIWNAKFDGQRPLLDADGAPLDAQELAPEQRIEAILLWSALPGASRHHWGTDVDLIDRHAIPADYQVQLTSDEFAPGGPFAKLAAWLERHAPRFGFFRPFRGERSGAQSEAWHFSFAPIAESARQQLTPQVLRQALAGVPLSGKEAVLKQLDELHERYVAVIDLP